MTFFDFKQVVEAEQIETFWSGIEVRTYTQDRFTYDCRQVNHFYIEYKTDEQSYLEMKCDRNPALLDNYIANNPDLNIQVII